MIIGIDLGTTNSLVAYYTENGPEIIPNRLGNPYYEADYVGRLIPFLSGFAEIYLWCGWKISHTSS